MEADHPSASERTDGDGGTASHSDRRPDRGGPVHDFIRCALMHDAIAGQVFELLYEHIVGGRYHPSVIAASLKPFIDDVLGAATEEDWRTVPR